MDNPGPTSTYDPVCPQWYSCFEVPSETQLQDSYMVMTTGPGGFMFCTCPAYRFRNDYGDKTCKHINAVLLKGCLYRGEGTKPGPNTVTEQYGIRIVSTAKNETTEDCPGCGQKMISTDKGLNTL